MTTNDEIYEKYMGKPFTLEDLAEGRIGKAVNDMLNSVRQDEREKKGSSLLTDVADHIADNSMVAEIGKQIIQARSDTAKQIKESLDKDFNVPILLNTQFRSRMEYIFKGLLEGKITEKEYNEYFKQYEVEYEKKKVEYQSFWSKILKE